MESLERPDDFQDPSRRSTSGVHLRERRPTRRETFPSLPPRLRPGERIGDYRIARVIVATSHSTVLEAVPRGRGRRVALKILAAHLGIQAEEIRRFRMESELARRVRHPAILPVQEVEDDRGYTFYSMRLEDGRTLDELTPLARTARDESFFVEIAERFVPLVRAVHELHEVGIVHRDVKPGNVLLDAEGMYVLTDFGSALDRHDPDPALEKLAGGTISYMSPEQLRPGADLYDVSGDIYSLGMTLYEVATGEPAFPDSGGDEVARLKLTRLPPPPRRVNGAIPMSLDAIIRRAIEVRPALRYETAAEMASELERFAWRRRTSPPRRQGGS